MMMEFTLAVPPMARTFSASLPTTASDELMTREPVTLMVLTLAKPSREIYTALASRMTRSPKSPVLAAPDPVRIDAKDALIEPTTLRDSALVDVRHHFVRPSGGRME